jgi:hypothetical protein
MDGYHPLKLIERGKLMDTKQAVANVSDADWQHLAKIANKDADTLKNNYMKAIEDHPKNANSIQVSTTDAIEEGSCVRRKFDVSLFKVVGVSGEVKFCGSSGSDWEAHVHICLNVAGDSVWCTNYKLSPHDAHVCFHPHLVVAKAQLCIGIKGQRSCFNISGNACYWGFGWHCADFDENLFCFR